MRILMIGGTRFVGRHIVEAAITAGHDVTVFHRGRTGPELFPEAEHRIGDRNGDLTPLKEGEWDATIDTCGYFPRQITELANALDGRGGQHVFISSVSVYDIPSGPSYAESTRLLEIDDPSIEDVTNDTYGPLKVLCERAVTDQHGDGSLIVRPTYVVGPDDYTWRFPYWVRRIARGNEVLVPGPPSDYAQVIDARDMATWTVEMIERAAAGVFHAVGPSSTFTWGEEIDSIAAAVAPEGTTLTWVDEAFLIDEGADGEQLPLWSGGDPTWLLSSADPAAAFEAGLRVRPLADTIRDTLAWTETVPRPDRPGLSAEREAELLARWHNRH